MISIWAFSTRTHLYEIIIFTQLVIAKLLNNDMYSLPFLESFKQVAYF